MTPKYRIFPIGGGGITPSGTLEIRNEGIFDVTDYAEVDVDIFNETTTKTFTSNGVFNASDDHVLGYSQVTVQVPASAVDSGTKQDTISVNGTSTIDVIGYANHEVTVSVPASAVDTGTLTIEPITSNVTLFTQDVVGYAALAFQVAVPASAVVSGTKNITANGTQIDVTDYQYVDVAVPASAVVSGTLPITQNGTQIDVTNYQYVDVAVPFDTWTGTQAEYNNMISYDNNTLYVITN